MISLRGISRRFRTGSVQVGALSNITLDVSPGEFVAIMGPSGSGKTTLLNIIGCLDHPSSGEYFFRGRPIHEAGVNEGARLRRETFGFVFQNYNLLPSWTAEENVEIPAIYAGMRRRARRARAASLLAGLGLASRLDHKPDALSGGEQQRVAIARALMNGGEVILADEPTGSLDSRSGQEIMRQLQSLADHGRTVIVVTHDAGVASGTERKIELLDGRIVADGAVSSGRFQNTTLVAKTKTGAYERSGPSVARILKPTLPGAESLRSALRAFTVNKFRTALTLLGIVIGVFSVTTMLGVAEGVRRGILETLSHLGGTTLTIQSTAGPDGLAGEPLTVGDANAIRRQIPNLSLVAPEIRSGGLLIARGQEQHAPILATIPAAVRSSRMSLAQGAFFNEQQDNDYKPVVVLGATLARDLFGENATPIGDYVRIHDALYRVIGILKPDGGAFTLQGRSAYLPLKTGVARLVGRDHLDTIEVVVADTDQLEGVNRSIQSLLRQRHGGNDFLISNQTQVLEAQENAADILRLLFGAIGGISLVVAGIGVMNIMLATVAERTREIGVRMATGARNRDILMQFVCEAVAVCGVGGLAGLVLAVGVGALVSSLDVIEIAFSPPILLIGLSCAVLTGLFFGIAPARRAARMDPVAALAAH